MDDLYLYYMTDCCMTTLLLCDSCGTHLYPLTSNSLVLISFVFLDLMLYTRLVNLFFLPIKLKTRSRVRWWAILMFGSAMEVGILMLTRVQSLKRCMTQNWKLWIFMWLVCYLYYFSHIDFYFSDAPTLFKCTLRLTLSIERCKSFNYKKPL